jgi:hypothetical protein
MKAFSRRTSVVAGGLLAAVYCQYVGVRMLVDDPSSETAVTALAVMGAAAIAAQVLVSLALGWTSAGRCDDAPRATRPVRRRGSHVQLWDARANRSRPRCGAEIPATMSEGRRRAATRQLVRAGHARRPAAHAPRR